MMILQGESMGSFSDVDDLSTTFSKVGFSELVL